MQPYLSYGKKKEGIRVKKHRVSRYEKVMKATLERIRRNLRILYLYLLWANLVKNTYFISFKLLLIISNLTFLTVIH